MTLAYLIPSAHCPLCTQSTFVPPPTSDSVEYPHNSITSQERMTHTHKKASISSWQPATKGAEHMWSLPSSREEDHVVDLPLDRSRFDFHLKEKVPAPKEGRRCWFPVNQCDRFRRQRPLWNRPKTHPSRRPEGHRWHGKGSGVASSSFCSPFYLLRNLFI